MRQQDSNHGPVTLPIEWHDCAWQPQIVTVRRDALIRQDEFHESLSKSPLKLPTTALIKPLAFPAFLPHPARRKASLKSMKKNLSAPRRFDAGFTLVELLVVIAIIALLAAMLFPVLAAVKKHALIMKARVQVQDIANAIQAYDAAYGRFPVSSNVQSIAQSSVLKQGGDFTYGGRFTNEIGVSIPIGTSNPPLTNSEVIAILMDITNYPSSGLPTVDVGHQKNPQLTHFLNAVMTGDTSSPGVGSDLVYRDPWGNPYIISLDLNYDEQCRDYVYENGKVSQGNSGGYNGLVNPGSSGGTAGANATTFQFHGSVMVWSAGPDGKLSLGGTGQNAVSGVNKDNVLSWQ